MIAALYVQTNGVYFGLPNVDPWDVKRDARLYAGPHPIVAHPPCSTWCRLAPVNQKRWGRKVGSDDGCFAAALNALTRWGGVLEHPAKSIAWEYFGLPKPNRRAWQFDAIWGLWTCQISQAAYGHAARKRTWLLYRGSRAPQTLLWAEPQTDAWIGNDGSVSAKRQLGKKEASATPIGFRNALIDLAQDAWGKLVEKAV